MKKILFIILIPLSGFAQKLPDFGIIKIRIPGEDKTILAEVYPVSKNVSPKNDKTYYWYGSNMIHTTQGGYNGKLLNGLYTEYYLNKNLKEQGLFKKGLKDGTWKTWNENGVLLQTSTWENGFLSGEFRIYSSNGRLKQNGTYLDNLLNGQSRYYSGTDSGKVVFYNHGKVLSEQPVPFWKKLPLLRKRKQPMTTIKQLQ